MKIKSCEWFRILSRLLNHSFVCCHHQKSIDIGLEYIICAFLFILPDTFWTFYNKKAISPYLFAFTMGFYMRIDCGIQWIWKERTRRVLCMWQRLLHFLWGWHDGWIIKRPRDLSRAAFCTCHCLKKSVLSAKNCEQKEERRQKVT